MTKDVKVDDIVGNFPNFHKPAQDVVNPNEAIAQGAFVDGEFASYYTHNLRAEAHKIFPENGENHKN